MKNKEIVSTIRNHFDSPLSDDNKLSERWVLFVLEKIRAALLYEDVMAQRVINDNNKQTISIPFVETDEEFCDCEGSFRSVCKILRSRCPIPKLIENKIYDISSKSGRLQFEVIEPQALKYKADSRIEANRKKIYVFFRTFSDGKYLYLANSSFIDIGILVGLFEEPMKAIEFNCCDNKLPSCNPLDEDFIIDDRLIPKLTEIAIKYFATALGRADILNNDMSDIDINAIPSLQKGSKK